MDKTLQEKSSVKSEQNSVSLKIAHLEERFAKIEKVLDASILGQSHVFPPLLRYLRRGEAGLTHPGLPRGSFVALGPTGVGKTETVKVLIEELWGDPRALVRLNMSEYKTPSDIKQFLGGNESKGDLQRQLEASGPKAKILLLDELEKGHKSIFDLLLQILDEGFIRFHNGDGWSFREMYIWATSNIGAEMATKGDNPNPITMSRALEAAFRREMRPEIVERFNCLLSYMRLPTEAQLNIAALLLHRELDRLNEACGTEITIPNEEIEQELVTFIRQKGYTKALGARRMRKTVQDNVQMAFYTGIADGFTDGVLRARHNGLFVENRALSQAQEGATAETQLI